MSNEAWNRHDIGWWAAGITAFSHAYANMKPSSFQVGDTILFHARPKGQARFEAKGKITKLEKRQLNEKPVIRAYVKCASGSRFHKAFKRCDTFVLTKNIRAKV